MRTILVGHPGEKRALGRYRRSLENNNNKMDIKEVI
jgi:hypothetical protein